MTIWRVKSRKITLVPLADTELGGVQIKKKWNETTQGQNKRKEKRENPFLILCICLSFLLIHCTHLTRIYMTPPLVLNPACFAPKLFRNGMIRTGMFRSDIGWRLPITYFMIKLISILVIRVYIQILILLCLWTFS